MEILYDTMVRGFIQNADRVEFNLDSSTFYLSNFEQVNLTSRSLNFLIYKMIRTALTVTGINKKKSI